MVDQTGVANSIAEFRAGQNFGAAIPAGIAAAIVGAALWATVVFFTGAKLGIIAVAVGALVGYAIRFTGKGIDPQFGVLGAVCAALGWGLGTIASDVAAVAQAQQLPILQLVGALDPARLSAIVRLLFTPMDVLFLAITVYEGYKFSFLFRRRR